jgi:predicted MFS family arabinose efflux permease
MAAVNPSGMTRTSRDDVVTATTADPPVALLAALTGVIVTNLFAPQPLVALIGPSVGLSTQAGGLVSTMTLAGYAAGLFFIVPLADLLENRRLVVTMLAGAALAALTATLGSSASLLACALFALGAACSAIQVLVPLAASMVPAERSGRVIGDIMGGVMFGILLSRPLASLCADVWGWRAFYAQSAVTLTLSAVLLRIRLARRRPAKGLTYVTLIASLWSLLRAERVLQLRAASACCVMACFSVFWTAVALRLAQPPFNFSQRGIAAFALAGAGGALVTPFFGRLGDRGWTRPATIASHLILLVALGLTAWGGSHSDSLIGSLAGLTLGAVLLDVGITGDQTLGRRAVNLLRPEARGRINGVFVGIFFIGGAIGSSLSSLAWEHGGWNAVCAMGAVFALAALSIHLSGTVLGRPNIPPSPSGI